LITNILRKKRGNSNLGSSHIGDKTKNFDSKKQSPVLRPGSELDGLLRLDDVDRLIALRTLGDLEFHGLTFF
jgi:hypothetical protein